MRGAATEGAVGVGAVRAQHDGRVVTALQEGAKEETKAFIMRGFWTTVGR